MAALFVRIPDELKRRLDSSAAARGTSLAEDVTRLLNEQLARDLPSHMKTLRLQTDLHMETFRANALEGFISTLDARGSPKRLAGQVFRMQEVLAKRRTKTFLERLLAEVKRQGADVQPLQAVPEKRRASPFDALLPEEVRVLPTHGISKYERRLWTLKSILSKRPQVVKAELAAAIGKAPAYVSQLLSSPDAKGHRKIRDEVARNIEEFLGLEKFTLDQTEKSQRDTLGDALADLIEVLESQRPERPSNPRRGRPRRLPPT